MIKHLLQDLKFVQYPFSHLLKHHINPGYSLKILLLSGHFFPFFNSLGPLLDIVTQISFMQT